MASMEQMQAEQMKQKCVVPRPSFRPSSGSDAPATRDRDQEQVRASLVTQVMLPEARERCTFRAPANEGDEPQMARET